MFFPIDKRKKKKKKAVMPSPKENELIEKVIEFDQSIEAHLRERERERPVQ